VPPSSNNRFPVVPTRAMYSLVAARTAAPRILLRGPTPRLRAARRGSRRVDRVSAAVIFPSGSLAAPRRSASSAIVKTPCGLPSMIRSRAPCPRRVATAEKKRCCGHGRRGSRTVVASTALGERGRGCNTPVERFTRMDRAFLGERDRQRRSGGSVERPAAPPGIARRYCKIGEISRAKEWAVFADAQLEWTSCSRITMMPNEAKPMT